MAWFQILQVSDLGFIGPLVFKKWLKIFWKIDYMKICTSNIVISLFSYSSMVVILFRFNLFDTTCIYFLKHSSKDMFVVFLFSSHICLTFSFVHWWLIILNLCFSENDIYIFDRVRVYIDFPCWLIRSDQCWITYCLIGYVS